MFHEFSALVLACVLGKIYAHSTYLVHYRPCIPYTLKFSRGFYLANREKAGSMNFSRFTFREYAHVACLILRLVTDKFSGFYFHECRLTHEIHKN